jgi:hypothetical protein
MCRTGIWGFFLAKIREYGGCIGSAQESPIMYVPAYKKYSNESGALVFQFQLFILC